MTRASDSRPSQEDAEMGSASSPAATAEGSGEGNQQSFLDAVAGNGGVNGKGKGKGKQGDEEEMTGMQNVRNLPALGKGMEGMGDAVWKGKGLTDSIKSVEVSWGMSPFLPVGQLTHFGTNCSGQMGPPSCFPRDERIS